MIKQREYSLVARSYATALFRSAQKQGILQRLQEECRVLLEVAGTSPRLKIFLENPQRPTEHKLELLDKVLKPRLSPMLITLIHLLVVRDRTGLFSEIIELFDKMVEEAEGIHHAIIQTARELGMQDKLRLKEALETFTSHRLKINFLVDPNLIGGLVFRYRDVLIDTSLSSGLAEIRERLLGTQILGAKAS